MTLVSSARAALFSPRFPRHRHERALDVALSASPPRASERCVPVVAKSSVSPQYAHPSDRRNTYTHVHARAAAEGRRPRPPHPPSTGRSNRPRMKTPRPRATRTTRRAAARIGAGAGAAVVRVDAATLSSASPPRSPLAVPPTLVFAVSSRSITRRRSASLRRTTASFTPMSTAVCNARLSLHSPEPFSTWARRVRPRPSPSPCARVSRTGRDRGPGPTVRGGASRRRLARPRRRAPRSPRPPSRFSCDASVPRPSSSMNTSERGVTTSNICPTSAISTA